MRRARDRWLVVALIAALVTPLAVAAVALRRPQWYPVLDLAMTELRLRDVFTSHTPLIGLPGRIGSFPKQGSHPGPMSFYSLWPTWKALGSTSWGMQVGALLLNAVASGTSVLIALRRGGPRLAIAVTAVLALLMGGYGISTLAEPWNPYLPLMWWVVTLLAVWSVLDGDVPMLPVAVVAASMAAQTHVPYLGLSLGLGALAVGALVRQWRNDPPTRSRITRWGGTSLALAIVLWSPLAVDQLTKHPGNLSMLWTHFTKPPEKAAGLSAGLKLMLQHLELSHFFSSRGSSVGSLASASGSGLPRGSLLQGVVVLLAWAAAAVTAWRLRHALLVRLHVVVAAALALGTISMAKIFGKVWYYLMLWAWATTGVLVLATVWTALVALERTVGRDSSARVARVGSAALVALTIASSAVLCVDAASAEPPAPQLSAVLAKVIPGSAPALDKHKRYLVTWDDGFYIGSQGYGVVNDLERLGFHVGVPDTWRVPVTPHRVLSPQTVDAEVHLAVGSFVERWRALAATDPNVRELSFDDPRSAAGRAEYESLRRAVLDELRRDHLVSETDLVDGNLFGLSLDDRLRDDTRSHIERMLAIG
ncbi:MAG: hypothetical protein QOI47_2498, partial [Actinomycetota bacterium]|nr:hypothetical protein [Actinomycetota bacterium]